MNIVILCGRLGKDAEVRKVGDGEVVSFSLATGEYYKDKNGERQERTEWHQCEAWGKGALAKYLTKGKNVLLRGSVRYDMVQTEDNRTLAFTRIRVDDIELLGGKGDAPFSGPTVPAAPVAARRTPEAPKNDSPLESQEDDLPF